MVDDTFWQYGGGHLHRCVCGMGVGAWLDVTDESEIAIEKRMRSRRSNGLREVGDLNWGLKAQNYEGEIS